MLMPAAAMPRKKARRRLTIARRKAKACKTIPGIEFLALDPCVYCGNCIASTHDHIDPVSKGGAHSIDNVARCCWRCNREKASFSLLVFLARRAGQEGRSGRI